MTLIILVFLVTVYLDWLNRKHGKQSLMAWAKNNEYQIIQQRCPLLQRGPFFWQMSKLQLVYQVKVVDRSGIAQQGWVCCGHYWKGCIGNNQVEVIWQR
jgi:hypothetical protein